MAKLTDAGGNEFLVRGLTRMPAREFPLNFNIMNTFLRTPDGDFWKAECGEGDNKIVTWGRDQRRACAFALQQIADRLLAEVREEEAMLVGPRDDQLDEARS